MTREIKNLIIGFSVGVMVPTLAYILITITNRFVGS